MGQIHFSGPPIRSWTPPNRFQTGLFLVKKTAKTWSLRQNIGKHKGEARAYVRAGNSEKSVTNRQTNRQHCLKIGRASVYGDVLLNGVKSFFFVILGVSSTPWVWTDVVLPTGNWWQKGTLIYHKNDRVSVTQVKPVCHAHSVTIWRIKTDQFGCHANSVFIYYS